MEERQEHKRLCDQERQEHKTLHQALCDAQRANKEATNKIARLTHPDLFLAAR
jgi:hypothetical protein